jgi:hypothetical protein
MSLTITFFWTEVTMNENNSSVIQHKWKKFRWLVAIQLNSHLSLGKRTCRAGR